MFKFIYPQKDSFVSNHPELLDRNFGIDEIIEIEQRKIQNDNNANYTTINSRGLVKFDISEISSSIVSEKIKNPKFFLELFTCEAIETPIEYSVIVNPISQSWDVGQGRLYDDLTTDGVSWVYRNQLKDFWSGSLSASLADAGISGSSSAVFESKWLKEQGGGTWFETLNSSSFGFASASMLITTVNDGDSFFLTSSVGTIYEFKTSQSIQTIQGGYASASVDFGLIENFERFCVSSSQKCCINVILPNTPGDCDTEFYMGWSGSAMYPTESKLILELDYETLKPEKEFELFDCFNEVTWSLRATNNPNIPDPEGCNIRFFDASGTKCQRVNSLANEINGLPNLFMTASVSQSFSSSTLTTTDTTSSVSILFSSSVSSSVSQSFTTTLTSNVSSSIISIITSSCDFDFSSSFSSSYFEKYSSSISSSISSNVSQSFVNYFTTSLSQSFEYHFTSSYNQFLILESIDMGSAGNCFYIWDTDDVTESSSYSPCADIVRKDDTWGARLVFRTANPCRKYDGLWSKDEEKGLLENFETKSVIKNVHFLENGFGVGKKQRFDSFVSELNNLTSSCGFSFNVDGYTVTFVSDVSGVDGNEYYFESGSNSTFTQSFSGGFTSSIMSQPDDIPEYNLYYFDKTSGSVIDSVQSLSSKINSVVNFVEANSPSSSIINLTATSVGLDSEQIGFQSGSTQVTLSGSKQNNSINSEATQTFNFESADINVDVTNIVDSWIKGDIPNEGFIIRNAREGDNKDYGKLRFYSQNTNTIYIPRLTMKWDDQIFSTGSLNEIDLDVENVVYVKNLKESYKYNEVVKMRLLVRDRYPQKTFTNTGQRFTDTKFLSQNTTFAVQDAESEEFLVPFDDKYTKVSCDGAGPYFILDMNSLPQERYFRLLFKTSKNDITSIFKEKGIFKVTR